MKCYLRKNEVAERYKTTSRNVERMAEDGRIPRPFYLNGSRIPYWDPDLLDENDRAAAARPRARLRPATAASEAA